MLKSVARLTLIAAALVLVSSAVFGQAPSRKAIKQLDSLASASRTSRVETAACVAGNAALIDSLTPATYTAADSETIYTAGTLYCAPGVPFVHTHLHIARPSPLDRRTLRRSGAAYALIVAVTDGTFVLVRY